MMEVTFGGKNIAQIEPSSDFNSVSDGCEGALSINKMALTGSPFVVKKSVT